MKAYSNFNLSHDSVRHTIYKLTKLQSSSVHSRANRSKNKRTFMTSSHCLSLNYREEKTAV